MFAPAESTVIASSSDISASSSDVGDMGTFNAAVLVVDLLDGLAEEAKPVVCDWMT